MKTTLKRMARLLNEYSAFVMPDFLLAPLAELPYALRYLPLIGLISGSILYVGAFWAREYSGLWAALPLLGINLLLYGGRRWWALLWLADGRRTEGVVDFFAPDIPEMRGEPLFPLSWPACFWGGVWIILLSGCYLRLLYLGQDFWAMFVVAAVVAAWGQCWLVYAFPALRPAWLHQGFSRQGFVYATIVTMLALAFLCCFLPWYTSLVVMLVVGGIWLFAHKRVICIGGLDDICYAGAAAWLELFLLLLWLAWHDGINRLWG